MDESLIREQEAQLQKTGRYYKHICFMAVPVLCMACFLYGVRPLLLCGIAVLTGNLCDRLVSLLRRRVYQGGDFSNESFALVIALLMPGMHNAEEFADDQQTTVRPTSPLHHQRAEIRRRGTITQPLRIINQMPAEIAQINAGFGVFNHRAILNIRFHRARALS